MDFQVHIEERCILSSYDLNPGHSVPQAPDTENYLIGDLPTKVGPFSFDFIPANCNFIKSYKVYVNNMEMAQTSPSWIWAMDADPADTPTTLSISSFDSSQANQVHSVKIVGELNTIPILYSSSPLDFQLTTAD